MLQHLGVQTLWMTALFYAAFLYVKGIGDWGMKVDLVMHKQQHIGVFLTIHIKKVLRIFYQPYAMYQSFIFKMYYPLCVTMLLESFDPSSFCQHMNKYIYIYIYTHTHTHIYIYFHSKWRIDVHYTTSSHICRQILFTRISFVMHLCQRCWTVLSNALANTTKAAHW